MPKLNPRHHPGIRAEAIWTMVQSNPGLRPRLNETQLRLLGRYERYHEALVRSGLAKAAPSSCQPSTSAT